MMSMEISEGRGMGEEVVSGGEEVERAVADTGKSKGDFWEMIG